MICKNGIWFALKISMFCLIQHVREEGAGLFRNLLSKKMKTIIAGEDAFPNLKDITGVLIMGGPMGVYAKDRYSFINQEIDFIKQCYTKNIKIFGVCLGAQMIAEALGGKVYKGHIQEIGWQKITHTEHAKNDFVFSIFPKELTVFQWHQDTFELPKSAVRLASSENYENQAFRIGNNIYGLQYHIEVTQDIIKRWFPDSYEKMKNPDIQVLNSLAVEVFKRFLSL